jgi:hypothetical protein
MTDMPTRPAVSIGFIPPSIRQRRHIADALTLDQANQKKMEELKAADDKASEDALRQEIEAKYDMGPVQRAQMEREERQARIRARLEADMEERLSRKRAKVTADALATARRVGEYLGTVAPTPEPIPGNNAGQEGGDEGIVQDEEDTSA